MEMDVNINLIDVFHISYFIIIIIFVMSQVLMSAKKVTPSIIALKLYHFTFVTCME
jgi:hypothetical protein